jgi:phosphatidylserine/phosphatidylglycerophosphate/cardiolipin synthase-like enzyme
MKALASLLMGTLLALATASSGAREPIPATGTVEMAFTPWDDAEGAILRALKGARHAIHVQAYLLTSRALARGLIDAKQRGVAVEVLADREMADKAENSQIPQLAAAGIPVWLEVRYAAAHNKIVLIDALEATGTVITGSYNFTWSAQARNAENLLILRDHRNLAALYRANFHAHRDHCHAPGSSQPVHAHARRSA